MKLDKLMCIVIAIGLISSGILFFQRNDVESGYKNYEITIDYTETERFASEENKPMVQALKDFKEAGVQSVNVTEASLNSLKYHPEFKLNTHFEGYDLVVTGTPEALEFVENGMKEVLKEERTFTKRDDSTLVIQGKPKDYVFDTTPVKDFSGTKMGGRAIGETSKLEYVGLGFLEDQIETSKASGLEVVLRPLYIEALQDSKKSVARFMNQLQKDGIKQNYILFAGEEALAWDDEDYISKTLYDNDIAVAMIEASVQREHLETRGMKEIAENMGYKAIRAFTTWQYIQLRYDYGIPGHHEGEEIMNTFFRAITERNIRLIYFKPFIKPGGEVVTDMSIYKARLDELQERLAKTHHITPGSVEPMKEYKAKRTLQMFGAFGVIAAGMILLDNLIRVKRKHFFGLFAVGAVLTGAIYALNLKLDLVNKLFGLAATIIFPTLSVIFVYSMVKYLLRQKKANTNMRGFLLGILALAVAIVISMVGAVYQVGFFAQSKYFLEMDIFTGVKISQMAPMALVLVGYLTMFGFNRKKDSNYLSIQEIKGFLGDSIKIWQALLVMVLLGVVALFLLRSGHETSVQPSSIELFFRNALEYWLPARPRNKAFLIGYPSLILFIYLASQKRFKLLYPAFGLLVCIGQTNILNTFSHIRTPLYISVMRVVFEFVLSIGFGALFVLLAMGIIKIMGRTKPSV